MGRRGGQGVGLVDLTLQDAECCSNEERESSCVPLPVAVAGRFEMNISLEISEPLAAPEPVIPSCNVAGRTACKVQKSQETELIREKVCCPHPLHMTCENWVAS